MNRTELYSLDLVVILIALLIMASCVGLPTAGAPAAPPVPTAAGAATASPEPTAITVEPTRAAVLADLAAQGQSPHVEETKGCSAAPHAAVYSDPDGAYCFAFPADMVVNGSGVRTVSLVGPPLTEGPDGLFVSLGVEATPFPIADLQSAEDVFLGEFAGFAAWEISAAPATLGGVEARRIEPVPGRLSSRVLLAVHGDLLYRLTFWPVDAGPASPALEALYATVTESFRFLDAPAAEGPVTGAVSGRVLHGETPVAGALVTLRLPDWRTNPNATLLETQTAADGTYALVGAPAGAYEVVAAWPAGVAEGAPDSAGIPVRLGDGIRAATADLALAAALDVPLPASGLVPADYLLEWQPVPDAAAYRVVVNERSGRGSPFAGDVRAPALLLEGLEPGRTYDVVVNALTASGALLAEGRAAFTVEP